MIERVAFTMYPVKDMARARAFYEDILGLPKSISGETSPWVEFDLPGGGCLAITTVTGDEPGGGTIAFEVEDLPALLPRSRARASPLPPRGSKAPSATWRSSRTRTAMRSSCTS